MKRHWLTVALVSVLSASAAADTFFSFSIGSGGRHCRPGHAIVRYHHPRVVVRHPVVRVVHRPAGRWEWRETRVWVPGYYEKNWLPPRYEVVFVSGHFDAHGVWINSHQERRLVAEGHYRNEWHPGYYRVEHRKVWVPY